MRVPLSRVVIACVGSVLFAACGSYGNGFSSAPTTASIRVVAGSPDSGSLDVRLDAPSGTLVASAAAYGTVGTYTSVNGGPHAIVVLPAGGTTATLTCPATPINVGFNYTVVVAGSVAKGIGTSTGLQCQVFAEPSFLAAFGDYQVAAHHAAPAIAAAGNGTLSFGIFAPATTAYQAPAGITVYVPPSNGGLAVSAYTLSTEVGVTTAPGVGFWFAPQTTAAPTSVLSTILPVQGQIGASGAGGSSDTTNLLPAGVLLHYSVFLIDGPNGTLNAIGAFD